MRPGLAVATIIAATAVTAATAMAQGTVTAPSNSSRSGVQSVITQTRDSLQRRMSKGQQQSRQQPPVKDPNLRQSDR